MLSLELGLRDSRNRGFTYAVAVAKDCSGLQPLHLGVTPFRILVLSTLAKYARRMGEGR
jgi:hypothetical protein